MYTSSFIFFDTLCTSCIALKTCCQVVDKIRIQMDAFLEDGSHEATVSVIRALAVAVPHTTDRLREYILSTAFNF